MYRKHILVNALFATLMCVPFAANAEPWTRTYVVQRFEPAFLFGGPKLETPGGTTLVTNDPGSDCPRGAATRDVKEMLAATPWRPREEIERLMDTEVGETRKRINELGTALAQRAYKNGINVYYSTFAAPDPGLLEVAGSVAQGFDLDNNKETGGFTSPDGQKGIDNSFYRAVGCVVTWRGGIKGNALNMSLSDSVRKDGIWVNTVLRVTGNDNPLNDKNATVEIAWSPDSAVRNARGQVAPGYSFRIAYGHRYTKLKAKVVNGVIETEAVPELRTSALAEERPATGELIFYKGRMKLAPTKDGGLSGLLGGYVKWIEPYLEEAHTYGPPAKETMGGVDLIAQYYALRRNADGLPDKDGRNTAISSAFEIDFVPAYVIEPPARIEAPDHMYPDHFKRRQLFLDTIASMAIVPFRQEDIGGIDNDEPVAKPETKPSKDSAVQ